MNIEQKGRANLSRTDDFFVPSSIATMFWRPRFLVDDPAMLHTAFLFWLVAAETPKRLAVCGAPDGAVFFALCQALDKHNIMAHNQWFGGWKDTASHKLLPTPPKLLRDHANLLYNDIATLTASVDPSEAAGSLRPNSLDLLFIDLTEQLSINQNNWLQCLKDTGLLLLHGTLSQQGETQQDLEDFLAGKNKIEFQIGDGLTIVLKDKARSARLESLLHVCADGGVPGEIALFYARLGQGIHAEAKETTLSTHLAKTRASLKALEKQQSETEKELSSLRKLVDDRGRTLSELQTSLFEAEQKLKQGEEAADKLQSRLDALQADKATLEQVHAEDNARTEAEQSLRLDEIAELTRQLSSLQAEKTAIEQAHAEDNARTETEQSQRLDEIAELTRQLSNLQAKKTALEKARAQDKARSDADQSLRFEEIAVLTRQLEVMRKSLEKKDTEVTSLKEDKEALLNSTSWRVTSPLRKLRRRF